jgi:fructose-1,6-bisphosphatase/sedoheptulose 1,7-bisphosphatase-like protein
MCCYDWGNEHPIGFVSDRSFSQGDEDYHSVMKSAQNKKKGFEMMDLSMPDRLIKTPQVVQSLKGIWDGKMLNGIRKLHINDNVNKVGICKKCDFKETYQWQPLTTL